MKNKHHKGGTLSSVQEKEAKTVSKKAWLAIVIIAVALLTFVVGCDKYPEYKFKGVIGDEKVEFFENGADKSTSILRVEKPDQSKIEYIDYYSSDLKIDFVIITTPDGARTKYSRESSNPAVEEVIQEAQKQFDWYLKKILEVKTAPLFK